MPTPERTFTWPFGLRDPLAIDDHTSLSAKAAVQWPPYWHYLIQAIALSGGVATPASWSRWFPDATVARQAWRDALHDGWWALVAKVRGLPVCGQLSAMGYAYARAHGWVAIRRAQVGIASVTCAERIVSGVLNAAQWQRIPQPDTLEGFIQTSFPAAAFKSPDRSRLQHVGDRAIQAGLSLMYWQNEWVWVLLDVRPRGLPWTIAWLNRTIQELVALGATPRRFLLIASPWRQNAWTDTIAQKLSRQISPRLTFIFPEDDLTAFVGAWRERSRTNPPHAATESPIGQRVGRFILDTVTQQTNTRPTLFRSLGEED